MGRSGRDSLGPDATMDDPPADDPRVAGLEARVAELERELEAARSPTAPFSLRALRLLEHGWGAGWGLRPALARRIWMDEGPRAYQCLPMVVANQWGWQVTCPTAVAVTWDGSPGPEGLHIEVDPQYRVAIKSQFGRGIVTFSPPWLFRTPPGWDLLVKGPANRWKPNGAPIEGVVETWWLPYTFTLNWKLVEPGTLAFQPGESLAQLVPVPHATFSGSTALEEPITADPEADSTLLRWRDDRRRIAADPVSTHRYYLKAEGIPDHLAKVRVPPVERRGVGEGG